MARNTYDIDEKLDVPFNINHLKRSANYVKQKGGLLSISLILNIMMIILNLLQPIYIKQIIDTYIPNKDFKGLMFIFAVFLATVLLASVFNYLQANITSKAGQQIINKIREDLYSHLQKLPFSYYDNRPHGKISVRVVNYINNVANFLSNGLLNILIQLLSLIFILFFMLSVSVKLTLVALSGLPFIIAFVIIIKRKQRLAWQDFSNKSSNLNAYLNESINGIRVTQSFAREEYNANIFKNLVDNTKFSWIKAVKYVFSFVFVIENMAMIVMACLYVFSALVFTDISLGIVIAMTAYASRFWGPIQSLGNIYNDLITTSAYLERIFEVLDEPIEIKDSKFAVVLENARGDIEFKNVAFSYENNTNVLENLSFKVKEGENIALVGPTGAGKTTIVNLISRFYDVNSGEILFDDMPINKIQINSLRNNMGIMLQDSFIFKGTIYDNIRYGKLNASNSEIIKTAKMVGADDFIMALPNGYNTLVNERGSTLSAGQKQLISFARTLISNPKVLIIDEATSSIDTETEHLLQEGIKSLLKGRTSFIIAHRLSTIRNCNKIFYISNKGISEIGTHNELLAKKGLYFELYNSQLKEI